MDRFDRFFDRLMKEEGGLSNDPDDSGGLTKYGISKAAYPYIDIRALTLDQAKDIYRRDYHDSLNIGQIKNDQVAYTAFDIAVNCGVGMAGRLLQSALNTAGKAVTVDGKIGPKTIEAANSCDASFLLFVLICLRVEYYLHIVERIPKNAKFLEGWLRRSRRCLLSPV